MSASGDPRDPRQSQPRDRIGRFASHPAADEGTAPARGGEPLGGAGRGPDAGSPPGTGAGLDGKGGTVRARVAALGRSGAHTALKALRSELARRFGQLAVAGVALGVAVVLLYATGDGPAALARASAAATSTTRVGAPETPARTATITRRPAEKGGPSPSGTGAASAGSGRTAPAPRPTQPAAVAAAWYAARNHLAPAKVRPLQQDRVGRSEVRVLVLGDRGRGRIDTALVRVRRDASGSWRVP
jgi:hypothetical protein